MFSKIDRVNIIDNQTDLLFTIQAKSDKSTEFLKMWLDDNQQKIIHILDSKGGILLKGFNIKSAQDFEDIAKIVEPNLSDQHAFDGATTLWHTQYTYEAASPSIKKAMTPLSFHNEDSFISRIPSIIMLCSLEPASKWGGESLLVDCRHVFNSLPKAIQNKYKYKTITSKLLLNDALFLVNSRISKNSSEIFRVAKEHGTTKASRASDHETQFIFNTPTTIEGIDSNTPVWFNTLHQAFYLNACMDIWRAYRLKKGVVNILLACSTLFKLSVKTLKSMVAQFLSKKIMYECRLSDGDKISMKEKLAMNRAYWENMHVLPQEAGSIIILNNKLIAHGRMPYKGRRLLLSCIGNPIMTDTLKLTP
jgi:hypothetical protein